MGKYKIGKDVGELFARVNYLENSRRPCSCSETSAIKEKRSEIDDNELFRSLKEAAPDEEIYLILHELIAKAGHLTIRDLFAKTSEDVHSGAIQAIQKAKKIGFLTLSNDKCCHEVDDPFEDDFCKASDGHWCSLVKTQTKWRCTLASDKC